MLELHNRTSFPIAIVPALDKEGRDYAVVVVKGTYDLRGDLSTTPVSEVQVPILLGDVFHGEPGKSSVKYESDTCLRKRGTDIVLLGHAYTRGNRRTSVDVTVQSGRLARTVRVFGDRHWYKSPMGWAISPPEPFVKIPLVYERAFGGGEMTDPPREGGPYEPRNPVGTGYSFAGRKEHLEGLPVPNLEHPGFLISDWKDKPPPAGFGFIGRSWTPRREYAGTYDAAWEKDRMPLLPADFDERYFNGAPAELVSDRHFAGGEPVRILNASAAGELAFHLPTFRAEITASIRGKPADHPAVLDTVVVEPDEGRILLTWRATIPCHRSFLAVDWVRVRETA
ncbi:MAG: DUF2169 domain-containing protein [Deltaproteobacteria bacterium]